MLYKYPKEKWNEVIELFETHEHFETFIMGAIHEGLGEIFVDELKNPTNAALRYKMLIAFGGTGLGDNFSDFFDLVPERAYLLCPNEYWVSNVKEYYGDTLTIVDRIKVSSKDLDINHIKSLKNGTPPEYKIVKLTDKIIDSFTGKFEQRYSYCYGNLDVFKEKGFGFCALFGDEIVSVAATILPFHEKTFEVQIDTLPDHQGKGLATAVCAHLIEYSLENGYDPKWDAFTPISARLAKKLGYTNPVEYQLLMLGHT